MNREQTKEATDIMLAFISGKKIKAKRKNGATTHRFNTASGGTCWNFDEYFYEIVQEPKTIWVNEYGGTENFAHDTKDAAENRCNPSCKRIAVEYKEVIRDE